MRILISYEITYIHNINGIAKPCQKTINGYVWIEKRGYVFAVDQKDIEKD